MRIAFAIAGMIAGLIVFATVNVFAGLGLAAVALAWGAWPRDAEPVEPPGFYDRPMFRPTQNTYASAPWTAPPVPALPPPRTNRFDPGPVLVGRLNVEMWLLYGDRFGEVTFRRVTIKQLHGVRENRLPKIGCVTAFCHLRGELRSFMAGRIVAMMDMDQGRAWDRFITIQGELRRRGGMGTPTDRKFEDAAADRAVFASLKAEVDRQGAG